MGLKNVFELLFFNASPLFAQRKTEVSINKYEKHYWNNNFSVKKGF